MEFVFHNCKINLGIPFLCLITGTLILDNSGAMIWCFLAILIHESGHLVCMLIQRNELREIKFCLFDIKILDNSNISRNYKSDIVLMASGPLANFLFALIFYSLNLLLKKNSISVFIIENICLAIFNILPIDSLDGGQILRCILNSNFDSEKSELILNTVSMITLLPLLVIGFYILIKSRYNFSLFSIAIYLTIKVISGNKSRN